MMIRRLDMLAANFPELPPLAVGVASAGKAPRPVNHCVAGFKLMPVRRRIDSVADFPSMDKVASAASNPRNASCTAERPRSGGSSRPERPHSCSGKRPLLPSSSTKQNGLAAADRLQNCSFRPERPRSSSGKRPSLPSSTTKQNGLAAADSLQNCFMTMSYTREAQRRGEEEEARRVLAEKVEKATEVIKTYMLAAGDQTDLVDQALTLMKNDQAILKACREEGVLPEVVDEFREKACRPVCERAFLLHGMNTQMSELQKQEVVNRILDGHSCRELHALLQDKANTKELYMNAVTSAVDDKSAAFHCPICLDPLARVTSDRSVDTSSMWFAPLRKNAHWSNHPCGHACCRTCMSTWVETLINDQKFRIKCPAECCTYSLWDQDIQDLVSPEVFERHRGHKNADYLQHLKESVKKNAKLEAWLKSNARPCPECHVIVSRNEGCDHMTCVCGTSFCYKCGFKQCKCNEKGEKEDIWNPQGN